ncbi:MULTISPECIES: hypothetical protein [unclassified Flavobacterium]|uniref:hypothetical protein n=1 Tax=unclassified Flavobacterium TaxID=196869 RepID=UPI001290E8E0|nr:MULTISPECIES: hypothetical protein [unclassified Flavobacterium]MQP51421.1 hypothetical protein [Flavobacterium sp. LMO9]MQP61351.1 hypothetical protein [Flavobacterium sp. LMO6]
MGIKNYQIIIFFIFIIQSTIVNAQVGINTTAPLSTLDINGNLSVKTVTLDGTNTGGGGSAVLIDDGVYISVRPLATDDKFQLPNPTLFPGRVYIIRNIQNSVTAQLTTPIGLLFPKNSTVGSSNLYMYEGNLRTVIVISDGVNWTYMN